MSEEPAPAPLAGIRILDLSRVLAGPWCAQALADLGADVIKLEHPGRGDDTRDWGIRIGATETSYYLCANRNKRSIAVDLSVPEGLALARDLARQSDVVIQNFRPGGAEKMGLGYAALSADIPGLVYVSIAGYAAGTSEEGRLGYDLVVQGEAGVMAMNGEETQPPLKIGVAVVDLVTGMTAAQGVLAALLERTRTGRGRRVDVALYDVGVGVTSYVGLDALVTGRDPARYGNGHPAIVPYGAFDAADGAMIVTAGTTPQFRAFCRAAIDRPDLADDPRYATNLGRAEHRVELVAELRAEIGKRRRADMLAAMRANGIPGGEVNGLHEALTSPRTEEATLVRRMAHPVAGTVPVIAPAMRLDGVRLAVSRRPPCLGEHTDEVLAERLALDAERLDDLRTRGIIR